MSAHGLSGFVINQDLRNMARPEMSWCSVAYAREDSSMLLGATPKAYDDPEKTA